MVFKSLGLELGMEWLEFCCSLFYFDLYDAWVGRHENRGGYDEFFFISFCCVACCDYSLVKGGEGWVGEWFTCSVSA